MSKLLIGHKEKFIIEDSEYEITYEIDGRYKIKRDDQVINRVQNPTDCFKIVRLGENTQTILHDTILNFKSKLTNGYACSMYDEPISKVDNEDNLHPTLHKVKHLLFASLPQRKMTKVGSIVQECKYITNKDFPQTLIDIALQTIQNHQLNISYDLIMFIPETESGDRVKNFTKSLAHRLNVPFSEELIKEQSAPQKQQKSSITKQTLSFQYIGNESLENKSILLIDDICDSGHSLKEAGETLTKHKAKVIVPLVLAKS
tara:strand:+ start:840 stop:1616 length:777 start_codon:yes stop_codon:yes gene_type:complete